MTRLNNYLLERNNYDNGKTRSVDISAEKFVELLKTKCDDASRNPIYRGLMHGSGADYLYIDPSKHTRVSEYTDNMYILLSEISPYWKKYPKLSKSIICTTSRDSASNWGVNIYKVYPFDGAKLAVTSEKHLWDTFPFQMSEMSFVIDRLLVSMGITLDPNETNPSVLKDALKKASIYYKKYGVPEPFMDTAEYTIGLTDQIEEIIAGADPYKVLIECFNPAGLVSLNKIGDDLPDNKQVWTESPCILSKIKKR